MFFWLRCGYWLKCAKISLEYSQTVVHAVTLSNISEAPGLIETNFFRERLPYAFVQGNCLIYLLDNIYIRFGTKLYRHVVGIPVTTNCAPLVADLFLFCYERDFMTSLSC